MVSSLFSYMHIKIILNKPALHSVEMPDFNRLSVYESILVNFFAGFNFSIIAIIWENTY